jgi:nicotinamide phosphoribosyltransferase
MEITLEQLRANYLEAAMVFEVPAEAMTDSYKIGMSMLHELSIFGCLVEIANSYSNFTPRKNAYMEFCELSDEHIVVYGTRESYQVIVDMWDRTFFKVDQKLAMKRLRRRTRNHFGSIAEHSKFLHDMKSLHDLGYLPLEVRAIDEGTKYPIGLPVFTVKATVDGYGWLVNFTETLSSGLIWPMINTATKIEQFFLQAKHYGELSAPQEVVDMWLPICIHEFGMRGYRGPQDQIRTSSCHNLFFLGSDTIGTIDFFEHYYGADSDTAPIAVSVRASEHADISRMLSLFRHIAQKAIDEDAITHKCVAVMKTAEEQANFKISTLGEGECVKGYRGGYFENIDEDPAEVFPIHVDPQDVLDNTEFYVLKYFVDNSTGIMSYVSDTENYYRLLNEYGAQLKGAIENREAREDGQPPILVFRPDSSRHTPLNVICGYQIFEHMSDYSKGDYVTYDNRHDDNIVVKNGKGEYYLAKFSGWAPGKYHYLIGEQITKEEAQGSLVSLWNTFGGAEVETPAGLMKLINPAVGLIYGEAISQKHQKEIYERMIEMGFSAVNVLMGKGSYASLENSTRDLFSMSYKQTFSEAIIDGERVNLEQQKTPMGDMSKKSAKGLLCVPYVDPLLGFVLEQEVSEEREQEGCLTLLLRNGVFYKNQTLDDIKANYASNTYYHLEK